MAGKNVAAQVYTQFVLDSKGFTTALKQVQSQVQGTTTHIQQAASHVDKMGAALLRFVGPTYVAMKALQGLSKIIRDGFEFNKFVQEQQAAFSTFMKSTDKAKAKLDELYEFAVKSPLTFRETVSASKQLIAYGFDPDELVETMRMLGTVAKATGHSLDDIAYVYGTLMSQGRAYTRDLMQFGMRGIPIYEELARVLGVDVGKIQKMTEAGKVGFAEVEQAFKNMTEEGGRYAGLLDEWMKTVSGRLSMLQDIYEKNAGVFTKKFTDVLAKDIRMLTNLLEDNQESFEGWGAALGELVSTLTAILRPLATLIIVMGNVLGNVNWDILLGGLGAVLLLSGRIVAGLSVLGIEAARIIKSFQDAAGDSVEKIIEDLNAVKMDPWLVRLLESMDGTKKTNLFNVDDLSTYEGYLRDIRDEYDKLIAENSNAKYAEVEYEYKKDLDEIERKFKDNEMLKKQALKIAEDIYLYRKKLRDKEYEDMRTKMNIEANARIVGGIFDKMQDAFDFTKKYVAEFPHGEKSKEYQALQQIKKQYAMKETTLAGNLKLSPEALKTEQKALEELAALIKTFETLFDRSFTLWGAGRLAEETASEIDDITESYRVALLEIDKMEKEHGIKLTELRDQLMNNNTILMGEAMFNDIANKFQHFRALLASAGLAFSRGEYGKGLNKYMQTKLEGTEIGKFFASSNKTATSLMLLGDAAWDVAGQIDIMGINIRDLLTDPLSTLAGVVVNIVKDLMDNSDLIEAEINLRQSLLNKQLGDLQSALDQYNNKLSATLDKQIQSLQDLFEVGAISGRQYNTQLSAINASRPAAEASTATPITSAEGAAAAGTEIAALSAGVTRTQFQSTLLRELEANLDATSKFFGASGSIYNTLKNADYERIVDYMSTLSGKSGIGNRDLRVIGMNMLAWLAGNPEFAVGSPNVPNDMLATVHRGEGIVPSTFMDSIRRGELMLSGNSNSGSNNSEIYQITVQGSVIKERDLAKSIAGEISKLKKRGYINAYG